MTVNSKDIKQVLRHFNVKPATPWGPPFRHIDGPGDFLFCQSCEELEKCQTKILTKCCKP